MSSDEECPHGFQGKRIRFCALCRAEAARLTHPTHDTARAAAGERPDTEDD